MSARLYAGLSKVGIGGQGNNDHWCADSNFGLFAVSDGMGKSAAAGVASQLVTEILPPLLRYRMAGCQDLHSAQAQEGLVKALADLSQKVYSESQGRPRLAGMGATVALVLLAGQYALIGHLGDSRVYQLQENDFRCLTKDHTLVQYMMDERLLNEEEAKSHPSRGQLTQYIGMKGTPCPGISPIHLGQGDRLLLCSDGLIKPLPESSIAEQLRQSALPSEACRRLVEAAQLAGGKDDVTVVVVD